MLRKRPFLIFLLVMGVWIIGALYFIQTSSFARAIKTVAVLFIPKDLGIQSDFSNLTIQFYPPGFSVQQPKVLLGDRNIVNLPPGSSIEAERIDFTFRLFQILSGEIRVHSVSIFNGKIKLLLKGGVKSLSKGKSPKKLDIHWDELLRVRAEAIELHHVQFELQSDEPTDSLSGMANYFRLGQQSDRGGLGYLISMNLQDIQGPFLKKISHLDSLESVRGQAFINALGVRLESLTLSKPGTSFSTQGKIQGNLLESKQLITDAQFDFQGQLEKILLYIPADKLGLGNLHSEDVHGNVKVSGKVEGDIKKPLETIRVKATLLADHLTYQQWNADFVEAEGRWDASLSGGDFALSKIILSASERKRVGGVRAGGGGKLEIGPVKWTLGSDAPIQIPVKLEQAHIHWLVAGQLKSVYPMDFRVNGSVLTSFTPSSRDQKWKAQSKVKISTDSFILDNQKLHKAKPLTTVFNVSKLDVEGDLTVNDKSLYFSQVRLALPHSKLTVQGKIDFKSGFDFYATGPVDLEDLNQIAENDIRGKGNLNVLVHGPFARTKVDIDVDVKDAKYLKLDLGSFKGRVVWDDDPSHVLLQNVQLSKGEMRYTAEGLIDVGLKDAIDLRIQIPKGNVQDLSTVIKSLTQKISWYPHTLSGPFHGKIDIQGGLRLTQLKVLGHLKGANLDYLGERFQSADVIGGYDSGDYFVTTADIQKKLGWFHGKISYDKNDKIKWALTSENLTLIDFDQIAQLDVPIRGDLDLQSTGEDHEGTIASYTEATLTDLKVRGQSMGDSQLVLKTQQGKANLLANLIGGQGVIESLYDFNPKKVSSIHAELKRFDFSPFLLLLNPMAVQDRSLIGSFSGSLNLSFHSGEVEHANGGIAISDYLLAHSGSKFVLAEPVSFKVENGDFNLDPLILLGKTGQLSLSLSSLRGQLDGGVTGDLDLGILQFFSSAIAETGGTAAVDLSIGGTLKSPSFSGRAKLEGDFIRIASIESPFEGVVGTVQLLQNKVNFQNFQATLGGGRVNANGQIVLFADRYPSINLKGNFNGSKLKLYPFQFVKFSGPIAVFGEAPPYLINGAITVESALSKERIINRKSSGAGLKSVQYAPQQNKQNETGISNFKLNISVDAPRGITFENDLFKELQAKASLTLVNTLDAPRILGTAEVLQGKILFKDHAFQIQSGTVTFDNPTVLNPRFDFNGNTEIRGVKVSMYVSGKVDQLDKMKVELTSSPAMQESDVLSLLATGFTPSDAKKLSANDLSVVQQGEAASLVLHSLGLSRDIEDKTGFQVQLDETINSQQGVSAFRTQAQADTSAAPQITIRRRLGDRLNLSAGSTVGVGTNKSYQLNLDFSVNQNFSLSGVFNNYGTYGSADAQRINLNSMGLDLKFQSRFK